MVKEKYNAVARTKDTNKINVNLLIKGYVEAFDIPNSEKKALILDSEKLFTKKTLMLAGVSPKNIFIPNPFSFDKIKKQHKNTYNMDIGHFINRTFEKFNIIFLDYMCSLDGNAEIKPTKDICRLFERNLPKEGCLLGVTLSWRGKKKGGCYNDLNRLDHYITSSAHENRYVAVKMPEGFSYKGMYFVLYKIYHQTEEY